MATLKLASCNPSLIEKGIPIPADPRKEKAWPLREMEVGDSFAFSEKRRSALLSAVNYEKRCDPSKRFTVRKLPNEFRCWRIA